MALHLDVAPGHEGTDGEPRWPPAPRSPRSPRPPRPGRPYPAARGRAWADVEDHLQGHIGHGSNQRRWPAAWSAPGKRWCHRRCQQHARRRRTMSAHGPDACGGRRLATTEVTTMAAMWTFPGPGAGGIAQHTLGGEQLVRMGTTMPPPPTPEVRKKARKPPGPGRPPTVRCH